MFQQTHPIRDQENKTLQKTTHRDGQILIKILQSSYEVIHKSVTNALNGFQMFVNNSERLNLQHNEYWWDSPEAANKLFKS